MTESGPVKGALFEGYRSFQAIPYAAPPVGERRWLEPGPVAAWSEPRDATKPPNACVQGGGAKPVSGAEDCLYLNVTTSRGTASSGLKPVMVWLHGGAFTSGFAHRYDPHRLAQAGDAVVVTVNYRLGIFGLLAHPGLSDTDFSLLDQQAALRWVQRNARAFGGDPNNVTFFGESAGGLSVCAHMTSPSSAGLFHRAGIQSGICTTDWPDQGLDPDSPAGTGWLSPEEARARGVVAAQGVGCSDPKTAIACMRNISAADLLASPAVQGPPAFGYLSYGSRILPQHPAKALAEGRFHRVPVLVGSNLDEGRAFVLAYHARNPITAERYRELLRTSYGENADRVEAQYPLSGYDSPALAWAAVITDRVIACPTLRGERFLAAKTPVYAFEFADRNAPAVLPVPPGMPPGAMHTSELLYLFDIPPFNPNFTEVQKALSASMVRYWTRFAKTGNPTASELPAWTRFRGTNAVPYVQSLGTGDGGIHAVDFGAEHQCDFWNSLE
ncbi:carboxylesterase family protein [Pendulispora brunnea]|uniref:Carboxylesterase family protein n=1 Tax=Pendulispora brunnea TaxID=2905690 RepID=A0ABZ2KFY0_9BACT